MNNNAYFIMTVQNIVLIDTWWNVNFINNVPVKGNLSFNRYMVECEYVPDRSYSETSPWF